jgi:ATP-binding cassette, subfamily F, member 3
VLLPGWYPTRLMLHLTDISKSFGTQTVLDRASLHVKPGMRIGLVGANGAGKTTLLRIVVGEMSLDGGEISGRKDLRIGFLPQEIEEIADHAVIEEVLASHLDILDAERRIAELGERISRLYASGGAGGAPGGGHPGPGAAAGPPADDPDELLHEMGALQTAFENAHGYELETRAQAILRGMGFKETDFRRPIAELSGGWRMRVALARLLQEQPDLLLMDEPTNHLDLESLIWLEEFLLSWPGALVVISHDRYFLNRMVTHIADLDRGQIDLYAGNYDHYEDEKRQRYEAMVNAAKNQQREIDSAEAFIRRFRAKNTKAKQVQQKMRQLEKTERIDAPTLERKTIKFRFPQPPRTGRVVAEIKHVRKAYADNVVYKRLDLVVERGEKIALVGPNGAGKSTLLKLLAGVIEPDSGAVKLGHAVRREYFAQHQLEVLHPGQTVLKAMEEVAGPVGRLPEVRGYLGTFLFGEDDVTKQVGVLSGGEKARLALARMLMDPAGLLLLDEPTNHLDMDSREVLTEALRQFEGSVVFISHDRHLINAIGTKVIEVRDGKVAHYPGDWEYYLWKKAQQPAGTPAPAASAPAAETSPRGGSSAKAQAPVAVPGNGARPDPSGASGVSGPAAGVPAAAGATSAAPKLGYEERKDLQRRYRKAEKTVVTLEGRQKELAGLLSDPVHMSDYELLFSTSEELTRVKERLVVANAQWEELAEAVGALEEERS